MGSASVSVSASVRARIRGWVLHTGQQATLRREEHALLRWIPPPEEARRAEDGRGRIEDPPG